VIRIGDFARLSHVSIATLRHYDEIGLLTPSVVDRVTGYRYYAVAQLPRLNRIVALKGLGFSLDQIQRVLQDGLTLDQLRGMLMLKQAEVEQDVAATHARLDRIVAQLRRIEQEDRMPEYDVALKDIPSTLVAARRVTIPRNDEVPGYLGPAFAEASGHVKRQGAKEAGPCLAVWYQAAAVRADEEADAAIPIDRPIASTDRVAVYTLPPARVASVVHHHQGESDDFTPGHAAILTWIEANGYRVAGPYREVYIGWDHDDTADAATEIQYPVDTAV
jgi:DNA-binding transcriptional MerR regulator